MSNSQTIEEVLHAYPDWHDTERSMVIDDEYNIKNTYTESDAKQALTSLIKELVAEAKPGYDAVRESGRDEGIDEFGQSLLKALEEV